LAWGLPTALLILGMFMPTPIRTGVWAGALIWMGVACIANAARCGRTHCYLTGPFFLAMAEVTVAHGTGVKPRMAVDRHGYCCRNSRLVDHSGATIRPVLDA
jgi:hypothetical protein